MPRAFGAFDELLIRLGARRSPAMADYVSCLAMLAVDCNGEALNPNEMRVVLQVLHMLATEAGGGTAATGRARFDLHVPNTANVLVPASCCYFNDSPWLASRVLSSPAAATHIAHPAMTLELCSGLGVLPLSRCIDEALDARVRVVASGADAAVRFSATATATLRSRDLALALARISVEQRASAGPAVSAARVRGADAAAGGAGGGAGGGQDVVALPSLLRLADASELLPRVQAALSAVSVVVVDDIPVTLTVGGTVFTTHSPLWYHDGPGRRLLLGLSANAGAGAFGLTSSLAAAVCHLLQVSVSAATESGRGAG